MFSVFVCKNKRSSGVELGSELVMSKKFAESVEPNKRQTESEKLLDLLHRRLRQHSDVVLKRMVSNCNNISVINKNALISFCLACQYRKNHKLKH